MRWNFPRRGPANDQRQAWRPFEVGPLDALDVAPTSGEAPPLGAHGGSRSNWESLPLVMTSVGITFSWSKGVLPPWPASRHVNGPSAGLQPGGRPDCDAEAYRRAVYADRQADRRYLPRPRCPLGQALVRSQGPRAVDGESVPLRGSLFVRKKQTPSTSVLLEGQGFPQDPSGHRRRSTTAASFSRSRPMSSTQQERLRWRSCGQGRSEFPESGALRSPGREGGPSYSSGPPSRRGRARFLQISRSLSRPKNTLGTCQDVHRSRLPIRQRGNAAP